MSHGITGNRGVDSPLLSTLLKSSRAQRIPAKLRAWVAVATQPPGMTTVARSSANLEIRADVQATCSVWDAFVHPASSAVSDAEHSVTVP